MYSETPPENAITSGRGEAASGGVTISARASGSGSSWRMTPTSTSTMRRTSARRSPASSAAPGTSEMPISPAISSAGPSMRTSAPSASWASSRPPTATAAVETISPPRHSANLVVPPPISTLRNTLSSAFDRLTAPEPCAAITDSRLWPADAQTNLPLSSANRSAMARALTRLSASPVRITAPESMSSGVSPAASNAPSKNVFSAPASIV